MKPLDFRHKRETLELTQTQLAVELGVRYQTISRYETGLVLIPKMAELALLYLESLKRKGK